VKHTVREEIGQAEIFADALPDDLQLLAGRDRKMKQPVLPSKQQADGRYAERTGRESRMPHMVECANAIFQDIGVRCRTRAGFLDQRRSEPPETACGLCLRCGNARIARGHVGRHACLLSEPLMKA